MGPTPGPAQDQPDPA